MQEKKTATTRERLAQLLEELSPEEQSALVPLLELMVAGRRCPDDDLDDLWERAAGANTLWEAGIDAQDWVDYLRGK